MSKTTQRVERLKKDFMHYHNQGYTIPEIAKIFDVDFSTIYNHLQEIADDNGVTRESLLIRPSISYSSRLSFQKDKTDVSELQDGFNQLSTDITQIIGIIDKILLTTERE